MFVSIAYRWGYLNGHWYFVYVGADKTKALAMAQAENTDRGGKYGCAVLEFKDDEDGEQDHARIAYFNSSWGEDAPFHNHKIDMFERLGHVFVHFAEGEVWLPQPDPTLRDRNGEPMSVLKPNKVDVPQWAKDELKRAQDFCNAMTKMGLP